MVSRLLHALTDTAVSRRGKFLVIAIWVILTLALSVFAPKLATFYNANSTQSIPATADSQVAQRLLLQKFPASHGTPAILVFSDPGGLSVNDRIHMHTVSDWLTSAQRPLSVGAQPEKETEAYQQ